MPALVDVNLLHHQIELVHINFRSMRQQLETELASLKSQVAQGVHVETAVQHISKLIAVVHAAKIRHKQLIYDLKRRAKYWMQYECIHSFYDHQQLEETLPSPHESEIDLPIIIPIANYLHERGCYPLAAQRLLKMRPEIIGLVDLESTKCEKELIEYYKRGEYEPILKWCRAHRSILRKTHLKLELSMQLKEYRRLIALGEVGLAISFGKKAFSKMNPVDYAAVIEVTSLFYKEIPQPSSLVLTHKKAIIGDDARPLAHDSLRDIQRFEKYSRNGELYANESGGDSTILEIQQAVRQVHRRPRQSPLVSQVLLGAAVLKTKTCQPGNHCELEALFDGYTKNKCPLCRSIKMKPLYEGVPFAIHTRSRVDSELIMLPSAEVWTLKAFKRQQSLARTSPNIKPQVIRTVYAL